MALLGTGSTGVQVAPAIADIVEQLHIFQREPGWILPKNERVYTEAERAKYRRFPILQKINRARVVCATVRRNRAFDADSDTQREFRDLCLRYIDDVIEDPIVRQAVTPSYPWGCKRPVYATTFYQSLNRPNVELVPFAVTRVEGNSIVAADGRSREVDAIILATGFQPTRFLSSLEVIGAGGVRLHDAWGAEPRAFLGITVSVSRTFSCVTDRTPMAGPSIIAQLERQAEVATWAIDAFAARVSSTRDPT